MDSWKSSIVINATADQVFAYIDEPMNFPDWMPSMVEVHNVIGTGAGQQYEWIYKMAGLLLRGQATVIEHVLDKCVVHQTIGTIELVWGINLEPHDEGTVVKAEVDYSIPIPVLGKLAEHIVTRRNHREFEMALHNIKDTVEA